jgi:hypothetical protein
MDEQERFREREETKRLLYVAMTRARDRLYLGTALKEGSLALGRGSLADVLPESLRSLFVSAAQESGAVVAWTAATARAYEFTICRASPGAGRAAVESAAGSDQFKACDGSASIERRDLDPRSRPPTVPPNDLNAADVLLDLPFSMIDAEQPGTVLRGSIRCVARHRDGSIEVLEEAAALAICLRAAKELFPGAPITGRVIYPTS